MLPFLILQRVQKHTYAYSIRHFYLDLFRVTKSTIANAINHSIILGKPENEGNAFFEPGTTPTFNFI